MPVGVGQGYRYSISTYVAMFCTKLILAYVPPYMYMYPTHIDRMRTVYITHLDIRMRAAKSFNKAAYSIYCTLHEHTQRTE